jgi:hypothetical protein
MEPDIEAQHGEFPETPAPQRPTRRRPTDAAIFVGLGVALVVAAISASTLVVVAALDTATPAPSPTSTVVSTPTPSSAPTTPTIIPAALDFLSDPNLNMHVSIQTTATVNARVSGHAISTSVSLEVDCAEGNEFGVTKTGSLGTQWWLVDGTYYSVGLDSSGKQMGKPAAKPDGSPPVALSPLFQLTEERMLEYVGSEQQAGILAEKLQTTGWWTPDTSKLIGIDVGTLGISPAHTALTLWVDSSGSPVYASFHAWTDDTDGTNLLDIETTYTFTNPGAIEPIETPALK